MDPPKPSPPSSTTPPQRPSVPAIAPLPKTPRSFQTPTKRINTGTDLATFLTTTAYRDILLFLLQLNRSLCPRRNPTRPTGPSTTFPLSSVPSTPERGLPPSIARLQNLLAAAEALIDLAPPDPGPRRFGNVSFRKWHELLAERAPALLFKHIPDAVLAFPTTPSSEPPASELLAYLLGSFGSSQRLDYGTGHELSFLAFLGSLYKLSYFADDTTTTTTTAENGQPAAPTDTAALDRTIVLGVIEPYLRVVRRLILTYTLEPAGSHGVWGLDDHSFLPYIFGSAQLTAPVSSDADPMPTEGSVRGAPKTGDIVKPAVVEDQRGENMYFSAVGFINDVKKGPFWEHSPILFDVSGVKDGWGKINKGMLKMFNAEVLQKFPVVQHFTFGSLFSWDQDPNAEPVSQSVHAANQPSYNYPATTTAPPPPQGGAGTAAPWAIAGGGGGAAAAASAAAAAPGRMPPPGAAIGIPYSRQAPPPSSAASARAPPTGMMPMPPGAQQARQGTADAQITLTKAPWAK
ncbi:phosphotyrosyl phosphate activator protein [Colletotrichum orchidophilum]|uniref:Serine/threonine-protein phosphatase 2A activator n=1 Tax=Colletotrichum orchidophilum TaxID=1209926 RepID=A0A1G4AYN3_9PEZI|nr:phosphotyrosyl phosphate activator protein [Colletotrichum orchidophilum]OHE94278.1 phosphotyrosyl phosphate activator protein [Colletotrichum orchidophilum]